MTLLKRHEMHYAKAKEMTAYAHANLKYLFIRTKSDNLNRVLTSNLSHEFSRSSATMARPGSLDILHAQTSIQG